MANLHAIVEKLLLTNSGNCSSPQQYEVGTKKSNNVIVNSRSLVKKGIMSSNPVESLRVLTKGGRCPPPWLSGLKRRLCFFGLEEHMDLWAMFPSLQRRSELGAAIRDSTFSYLKCTWQSPGYGVHDIDKRSSKSCANRLQISERNTQAVKRRPQRFINLLHSFVDIHQEDTWFRCRVAQGYSENRQGLVPIGA